MGWGGQVTVTEDVDTEFSLNSYYIDPDVGDTHMCVALGWAPFLCYLAACRDFLDFTVLQCANHDAADLGHAVSIRCHCELTWSTC